MMVRISLIAAAAGLFGASSVAAQSDALVAEIGAKFSRSCTHCHQPPDLQFASDRAWLDQVHRTA